MERLTYKSIVSGESCLREGCGGVKAAIDRLAAYEDTGRTPEEVREMFSWSYGPLHKKIGELLQAEDEGRLVVLPCKVGTHLWKVTTPYRGVPHVSEFEVRGFKTQRRGRKIQIEVRCLNVSGTGFSYYEKFYKTRAEAEAALKGVSEDG